MSARHLTGWTAVETEVYFGDGGISMHMCGEYQQQVERAALIAKAPALLDALRELVAVKQEREEISRRRQRRSHSRFSNPQEVDAVQALHEACKIRESRA